MKGERKMKMRSRKILAGVTALALCLVLTACGSSQSAATPSPSPSPTETPQQVIKVGMMATLKPFVYTDDSDNIIGYDIDMLNAIDELLPDYTFEYQNLQFSVLFTSLENGTVDMLTGTIGRNAEREAKYLVPSIDSGYVVSSLVVPEDDTATNSFDDMAGKKIPMDPARYEYNVMKEYNDEHPDKAMVIVEMADVTQADSMKMVADGRCDAALIYRDSFEEIQKELDLPVRMSDVYAVKQPYCQLINPSLTEFGAKYEEALQTLIDNGTMSQISVKWLGYDMFADN